jgi:hypothetical protein
LIGLIGGSLASAPPPLGVPVATATNRARTRDVLTGVVNDFINGSMIELSPPSAPVYAQTFVGVGVEFLRRSIECTLRDIILSWASSPRKSTNCRPCRPAHRETLEFELNAIGLIGVVVSGESGGGLLRWACW